MKHVWSFLITIVTALLLAYYSNVAFGEGVNMMEAFSLLPDPQTNGGLLFSVNSGSVEQVSALLAQNGLEAFSKPIGRMTAAGEKALRVEQ